VWPLTRCTASTAAQRTNRLPCLSVAPEMSTPRVPLFLIFFGGGWVRQDGGWGPGSGAARPRSGRRAWMPTPGLTHHRRRCGEDHSAADHRRGMITPVGGWACSPVSGCVGRPCLSGCSATEGRRQDGDRGVSTGCGRSFLVGCPARGPAATGLPGADRRFIGGSGAARGPGVREIRRRGRGPGRRGCAVCGGSGGRAFGPWTATPADRPDGP
jgi:hypothetical protein